MAVASAEFVKVAESASTCRIRVTHVRHGTRLGNCAMLWKGSQKMTESTWVDGTSCQHFLGNSLGKTLGIARSRDEIWCSGKTDNVHGKLGRHDGRVKRNRNMFRWSIHADG